MSPLRQIESVYFIGIGGIGMSALARYFNARGMNVSGYDRASTALTSQLIQEGIKVHFRDDPKLISESFLKKNSSLIVFTPAVSSDHKELNFFRENGFHVWKRAEILGKIIWGMNGIAIAGTHGKTTVSTMLSVILHHSEQKCNAFLGGISNNFESNILIDTDSTNIVVEADEFDRSFLQLYPQIAVVTALDPDHLDIYGDFEHLRAGFDDFLRQISSKGKILINNNVCLNIPEETEHFTYSLEDKSTDFYAEDISREGFKYNFTFVFPGGKMRGMKTGSKGKINLENTIAALSVAHLMNCSEKELRDGIFLYNGVKRRFDIHVESPKIYIDDYAHHPKEIQSFVTSVKEAVNKPVTGVFQPHLYSRTSDFYEDFAQSLSLLDNVILLDIYPAREEAVPGVSSKLIFDKLTNNGERILCSKDQLFKVIENLKPEVLLSMGAGNIDQMVPGLKSMMEK